MSSVPKHSWFNSGLRFCGSCCITLSYWTIWLLLGALLALLLYIAVAREFPVPGFVLRRIEKEMDRSDLALSFGRARFDPTGKVLLEDVRIRSSRFDDPLLTCRLLYVRHNFWSLLAGQTAPAEIQIEGAVLQLPAMLAPSGVTEPLVRDFAATLSQHGKTWNVDQLAGRLGPLTFTLHGTFTPPRTTGRKPDLGALTGQYLQFARQLAPLLARLDSFENPALAMALVTDETGANRATLRLSADAVHHPWGQPVQAGFLLADTTLRLDLPGSQIVPVHLLIRNFVGPGNIRIDSLRSLLMAEIDVAALTGRAQDLQIAAGLVDTAEGLVFAPWLRAGLAQWPVLHAELAAQLAGEFLAASGEADLAAQSARIHAAGRANPDLINRVLARHTPRAAPFFLFGDSIGFEADALLGPGWRFESLAAWAEAGRLDSRGVNISSARGRIDIVGKSFLAHDARVTMGENEARGSYWMDFGTTDYRMLLEGRLHPAAISGWFHGDWWPAFWDRYFDFSAAPPSAEVDVQGRWKDPSLSWNFVRARTGPAKVWGGDFERTDATVFVRPTYTHGLAVEGWRAGDTEQLAGSFKRFGIPGSRETARFEFDLTTNADPTVLGRMLEGRADDVLDSLRFTRPPRVHAWGAIASGRPDYHFTGESNTPLHYYGFPLDTVRVSGRVQGEEVQLADIGFSAAGGQGAGKATLNGPPTARRLGFDLFVNKARLSRTVRAVQEYDANRTGIPAPAEEAKFVRQAANSILDVSLTAQGDPADLNSFKGSGNAALTGAELGEIHLFGLLSQVLSGLSLSFSSLKLDAAHTRFDLQAGELLFPDFKVTGPSAVIDGRGRYNFASNRLDFAARFRPYQDPGSLLAAAVSLVLNPLTSIFELKLTGPLADPKWSVLVSSGSDPSKPTVAAPATGAPPPDDDKP